MTMQEWIEQTQQAQREADILVTPALVLEAAWRRAVAHKGRGGRFHKTNPFPKELSQ